MKKMTILFCVIIASYALQVQDAANDKVDNDAMNQLFGTTYTGAVYSGYLSANDAGTAQFHYMFYPSEDQPLTKPVILWLNGGPGCSSLQGAFNENGPFVFKAGTATFESNAYSWTKIANMLYIESPIAVGFSYGPAGQQSDESTAQYNIHALVDFFSKFQDYKNSKFFITGESYAGIYIPTLASQIIDYNAKTPNNKINLQGIAIGNGCTDPTECTEDADPFPIHQMKFYGRQGFISETLYEKILAVQQDCYGQKTGQCKEIADQVDAEVSGKAEDNILFNPYNIYGYCFTYTPDGSKRSNKTLGLRSNDDSDIPPCADVQGLYHYLKNAQVRSLLHISDKAAEWVVCSKQFGDYKSNPLGSYYLYPKIIKSGVRILKFSGDVDAIVPLTGTLYWVDKLQKELYLTTLHPWRPWFVDGQRTVDPDQNAGYVVDLDGLTLLTIRNAGHMVPLEKRLESLVFLTNFINNDVFP